MKDEFTLTFFGVRGSYPVPGRATRRYGGNTSSLLLEVAGRTIILDAGTGIIQAGRFLSQPAAAGKAIHIFLSHLHSDHIMGLPFFSPMFNPAAEIFLHYPEEGDGDARRALEALFLPPYSPITLQGIKARLSFAPLAAAAAGSLDLGGGVEVAYIRHDSHPRLGVLIYRVGSGVRRMVYATDVESPGGFSAELRSFITGADLLVHDSQYFEHDYSGGPTQGAAASRPAGPTEGAAASRPAGPTEGAAATWPAGPTQGAAASRPAGPTQGAAATWPAGPRRGFGHSTVAMAARNAAVCKVKRLFLFHYDPKYSDAMLDEMRLQARREFPRTYLAREGQAIEIRR
jgi:ribonuclease BN (tRNA processing enzyme)